MALRALKFDANDAGPPVRSELPEELIRTFARSRLQAQPAAYVVLNNELPGLRRFEDLVVDRGRKHEAKPIGGMK